MRGVSSRLPDGNRCWCRAICASPWAAPEPTSSTGAWAQRRCSLPWKVSPTPSRCEQEACAQGAAPFPRVGVPVRAPRAPSARLALLVDASPRCEQVRVSRGALLLAAASLPHFDVLRLGAAAAARVPAVHTDLLKGRHCAHRPRCNSTSRGWYTTTPESTSKSTSTSATSLLRTPRGSRVCSSDAILFLFRSG